MSFLYPTRLFRHISDIPVSLLKAWEIQVVVLDVDNTLTTHNNPMPDEKAMAWLEEMKNHGFRLVILSNNRGERVRLFAQCLGLEYTANAMKPLPKGFGETARRMQVVPEEMVVVGDQIFTDILGANLFGCRSILVEPIQPETNWFFRLKRQLEKGILKGYRKLQQEKRK